jgi:DNA-binding transcriptional ArsR family regulator
VSFQAVTWAMSLDIKPAGKKFTLVALAAYADGEGTCFPGQKRLASDTSQSDRAVRTHLASLEEDGLLKRSHRQRQDGSRTSDQYTLNMGFVQPEMNSAREESNRKTLSLQPETDSGLTSFEPVSETLVGGGSARDPERIHERCCEIIGVSREKRMSFATSMTVRQWLNGGVDPEIDIYPTLTAIMVSRNGDPPGSMAYFTQAVARAKATRETPLPAVQPNRPQRASAHATQFSAFAKVAERARQA